MCVLIFSIILPETFFTLRIIRRDIVKNVCRSSCKVPVFLVRFYLHLHLLNRFFEKYEVSNFMKICQVGAELLHVDGQTNRRAERLTDMTELIVAFRNFAIAPKPE